mmetsp:Transcript_17057/g.53630  ORF Transcript_17057/g.53630 Transcript_17057/m.53630 type:complete len:343 (+) Transcript_17057:295-1323(+)
MHACMPATVSACLCPCVYAPPAKSPRSGARRQATPHHTCTAKYSRPLKVSSFISSLLLVVPSAGPSKPAARPILCRAARRQTSERASGNRRDAGMRCRRASAAARRSRASHASTGKESSTSGGSLSMGRPPQRWKTNCIGRRLFLSASSNSSELDRKPFTSTMWSPSLTLASQPAAAFHSSIVPSSASEMTCIEFFVKVTSMPNLPSARTHTSNSLNRLMVSRMLGDPLICSTSSWPAPSWPSTATMRSPILARRSGCFNPQRLTGPALMRPMRSASAAGSCEISRPSSSAGLSLSTWTEKSLLGAAKLLASPRSGAEDSLLPERTGEFNGETYGEMVSSLL